jgi:hypothetical protein
MRRCSSPGGGAYKRHRSCGRIKKRVRVRRRVVTRRVGKEKVGALFMSRPLVSPRSGEHRYPTGWPYSRGARIPCQRQFRRMFLNCRGFSPALPHLPTHSLALPIRGAVRLQGRQRDAGNQVDRVLGRQAVTDAPYRCTEELPIITIGQLQLGITFRLLGYRPYHGVGDIGFPSFQHGQAGGVVRNTPHDEVLEVAHLAPIAFPGECAGCSRLCIYLSNHTCSRRNLNSAWKWKFFTCLRCTL